MKLVQTPRKPDVFFDGAHRRNARAESVEKVRLAEQPLQRAMEVLRITGAK